MTHIKDEETQNEDPQIASLRGKVAFLLLCPKGSPDLPRFFISSLRQLPGTGLLSPLLKAALSANGARGKGLEHPYLSRTTILATLKYDHVNFFFLIVRVSLLICGEKARIIKLTDGDSMCIVKS